MKKIIILIVSLAIVFSTPMYAADSQLSSLKIGDFVYFGEFNSLPILWQVIHVDNQKNPLLFAVSSIRSMAFDAAESGIYNEGVTTRKAFGSNYWKESNIRDWLNSAISPVIFSTTPPTAEAVSPHYNVNEMMLDISYNEEPGFLFGFSQKEKSMILDTPLTTALPYIDIGLEPRDSKIYSFTSTLPSEAVSGHWAKVMASDSSKVFLLGINEFYDYVSKKNLIGDKNESFWLRTPEGSTDYLVSIIDQSGAVMKTSAAFSSVGVRPALYLDNGLVEIESGIGSAELPYELLKNTGNSKLISQNEREYFQNLINEIEVIYRSSKKTSATLEELTKKIEMSLSVYYEVEIPPSTTIEEILSTSYFEKMENSRAFILESLTKNLIILNRRIELEPYLNVKNNTPFDIVLTKEMLKTSSRYKRLHIFNEKVGLRLDSFKLKKELQDKNTLRTQITQSSGQILIDFLDESGKKINQLNEQVGIYISPQSDEEVVYFKADKSSIPLYYDTEKAFFHASSVGEYILKMQTHAFSDTSALIEENKLALDNLVDKGIIDGYLDNTFRPYNSITRGEVTKILNNLLYTKSHINEYKYVDIYGDEWYAPSVLLLSQEGLIKGYPNGMFKANQNISLQEIYTLLSRILKKEHSYLENYVSKNQIKPEYTLGKWATEDVALMHQEEFFYKDLNKNLSKSATRIEVVRLVDLLVKALFK